MSATTWERCKAVCRKGDSCPNRANRNPHPCEKAHGHDGNHRYDHDAGPFVGSRVSIPAPARKEAR